MSQKKSAWRKTLRYVRWSVKVAFLLLFLMPINYFSDPTVYKLPVRSLTLGGLTQPPLFYMSYGTSVCSFQFSWTYIGPGTWYVCPVGGLEVLLTAGIAPKSGLQVGPLLLLLSVALLLFFLLIFLFGSMFCSWVCPVGTIIDGFDKGVERFMPKINMKREERLKQSREKSEKNSRFVCPTCTFGRLVANKNAMVANGLLVSALVGSAILRLPVWCSVCPIGISSRGMFHLKAWNRITGTYLPVLIELWIIPVVAVLLSLREKRYWCRKICPLGALVRFFAKFNPFFKPTVKVDKHMMKEEAKTDENRHLATCSKCSQMDQRTCERVCPQGIGPLRAKGSAECTKCLECYVECEQGIVGIKRYGTPDAVLWLRRFFKKQKRQPEKQERLNSAK